MIVPVDVLQTVPWSALHDAPISLSPSASFWANTRRNTRSGLGTVLLVAGPELPAAEEEIRRLSSLHRDSVVLCPPDIIMKFSPRRDSTSSALAGRTAR